jgi:hypothetical protein
MEVPMESVRQMLGAMFIALGDAGGPDVLERACPPIDSFQQSISRSAS